MTQDDPIYILPFFEEFFRDAGKDFEIVMVSSCQVMGKRSRRKLLGELWQLYGPVGFVRLLSRAATMRATGFFPRTREAAHFGTLKQLCRSYGMPFQRLGNPNSPEYLQELKDRNPDVLVSVACPYILKEPLLKLPPLGCINIHHAPLPRYKGMMPTFWQMYHGERKVGVTVHYMAPKVDDGAPLLQEELEILPGESLDHLIRRSKRHGAHCMAKVLRQMATGTQKILQWNTNESSIFTFPTAAEIREFQRRGFRAS
ncbi:MAG: formyltransferase family protein [Candidatus Acidiferrales bacterium]